MVIPDPGILMQAAGAIKNGVDALKNGIELVRTIAGATTGSAEQKKVLEQTLATASSSAAFAEAELARGFGYELCKCTIPPTPMLTVGFAVAAAALYLRHLRVFRTSEILEPQVRI